MRFDLPKSIETPGCVWRISGRATHNFINTIRVTLGKCTRKRRTGTVDYLKHVALENVKLGPIQLICQENSDGELVLFYMLRGETHRAHYEILG